MSIQILAARFQEKQDEIDRLRAALQRAEAERISERTARIAKVEELGRYITHYESAIRAVTLAIDQRDAAIARAEKYLKAMTEWIEIEDIDRQPRAHKDKTDDEYSAFLASMETRRINAVLAIRAIVEEAKRG